MKKGNTAAYLALALVCLVWGTTYLALRIGVETFPAFLFSAIRQLTAGTLLFGILVLTRRKLNITKKVFITQSIAGTLMIGLGNGLVGWAEIYIPSGLASMITSILPLFVVIISYSAGVEKKALNRQIIGGLFLGCLGIALIFRDNLADLTNPNYLYGILVTFIACFSWSAGTVYAKHNQVSGNAFVNAAIQLSSGSVVIFILSFLFDDYSMLSSVSMNSILALIYLIIVGSLIAYGCFLYALERLPAGLVSIYAYINPLIAIVLGALILNEKITWLTALAFVTIIASVYSINKGYAKQKASAPLSDEGVKLQKTALTQEER